MDENEKTQVEIIEENVKKFNKTIGENDKDLLTYSVEVVIDRALLYLGHDKLDKKFEKVVADVVSGVFTKYKKNANNEDADTVISSMSDNGQSISYSNEIKNYLASTTDNELFGGFVGLLSRYRRIKVVCPK